MLRSRWVRILVVVTGAAILLLAPVLPYFLDDQDVNAFRSRPDMYTAAIEAIATFAVGAVVIWIGALLMPRVEEGMRSFDPALPLFTT